MTLTQVVKSKASHIPTRTRALDQANTAPYQADNEAFMTVTQEVDSRLKSKASHIFTLFSGVCALNQANIPDQADRAELQAAIDDMKLDTNNTVHRIFAELARLRKQERT